ncbi:MAG: osmoprotectant transport system permease protein [Pseudonocardiales bacterium]|jgi:ABC-type proline/glycine betaine transport system permease subunit|nr:osmoprotectant transport system permease protein [Pseudonocardiales bacterium]
MTVDALSAAATPARAPRWIWRNRDLVATPVIVVAGLALVLVYTVNRQLDSVEQRALDPSYLWAKFVEHIWLTAASTVLVIAIALPLGVALSRPALDCIRSGTLAFGGFMQALPPYGVIILLAFLLKFGTTTAIIALVAASFLPVLTNTVVGLRQVDPALIEVARGMGMSARQTLLRVEIPLAVPVMVAGIRVALVLNVGTATLATFIGAGGLGEPISSMLNLGRPRAAFVVSAIVAALALLIDWLAGVAERLVSGRIE